MTDSLQKQILSLLPSETLKKEITNKSWRFSNRDLIVRPVLAQKNDA